MDLKKRKKVIAIVAHDNRKADMVEWVGYNSKELASHQLVCTGTTGRLVEEEMVKRCKIHDEMPPEITRLF
ncbi:MAG: hypothetical protein PF436_07330 [Prolixibacteraceae bacterium]|jgi:methylglyoxal synthase|nr:hypothetical protein [Prolixibacteraceae bacterium]